LHNIGSETISEEAVENEAIEEFIIKKKYNEKVNKSLDH